MLAALALCSIPDDGAAVTEMPRVLRPGGQLLLVEHVASPRPLTHALKRLLDPLFVQLSRRPSARPPTSRLRPTDWSSTKPPTRRGASCCRGRPQAARLTAPAPEHHTIKPGAWPGRKEPQTTPDSKCVLEVGRAPRPALQAHLRQSQGRWSPGSVRSCPTPPPRYVPTPPAVDLPGLSSRPTCLRPSPAG